jgi:tetratricopeptide (TPR) repeat protein
MEGLRFRLDSGSRATYRSLIAALILCFSTGSAIAQNRSRSLDDYFNEASRLEKQQDFAGAEKVYQAAAQDYPNQPEVSKRLGIVCQTELKFQESIDLFNKVLQAAAQYPEVNFYLGLSYFGLNEFEKAIDAFNRELAVNPKYRRAHYYEALAFQSLHRDSEALHQYELLLQDDPKDQRVLYQVIRFHKAATLRALDQLGNLDPNSEFMLVLKGEGYADEGKYDQAIEKYNLLLKKNPNFPSAHFGLGVVYWRKADYRAAEPELRLALREDPNHPMANYYLADTLLKTGRPAEAVPLLEIAVAADDQLEMAYFQLGKCYITQGKLQEALKVLLKAAALDPSEKSTHYQLAQLYERLKQPAESKTQMDIFRELYAEERQKKQREQVGGDSADRGAAVKTDN